MLEILPHILLIFTAFAGVILTLYIRTKKSTHQPMVCPLGADCNAVIHSEYAHFLGIPVELLGMVYYAAIAITYAVMLVASTLATPVVTLVLLLASTAAVLFSFYLTFIQGVLIKQWCTWCLTSAGLCAVIFLITSFTTPLGFLPLIEHSAASFEAIRLFGLAIGLGAATVANVFFIKFLRDFRISHAEDSVVRTIAQIVWLGLAIVVLTDIALFIPHPDLLITNSFLAVHILMLCVLIINSATLNLFLEPKMVRISFGAEHPHHAGELQKMRKTAYALIGVSLASWYAMFAVAITQEQLELSTTALGGVYLGLLVIAAVASQLFERFTVKDMAS